MCRCVLGRTLTAGADGLMTSSLLLRPVMPRVDKTVVPMVAGAGDSDLRNIFALAECARATGMSRIDTRKFLCESVTRRQFHPVRATVAKSIAMMTC